MIRPLRLQLPGGVYHVMSRGNRREPIFRDDEDRLSFLAFLATSVERYHVLCHGYCLMGNHFHLLIETPNANLAPAIRYLKGCYAMRFNRKHRIIGHLFERRYKSILLQKESYLLELARYIVLNPVRAGLVEAPEAWRWSSYRSMVGKAPQPAFLTIQWLLSVFNANSIQAAQRSYRVFVEAGIVPSQCEVDTAHTGILGDSDFVEQYTHQLSFTQGNVDFRKQERFASRPTLMQLLVMPIHRSRRNELIVQAHLKYGYSQQAIARHLELHYSTISRIIKAHVVDQ